MNVPPVPAGLKDPAVTDYLQRLAVVLQRSDRNAVRTDTAVGSVLLVSPNGSVYTVGVADDGTVTTTLVSS